jgi:hypothetical protein
MDKAVATLGIQPFERLTPDAVAQVDEEAQALVRFMEPDATQHQVAWHKVPLAG